MSVRIALLAFTLIATALSHSVSAQTSQSEEPTNIDAMALEVEKDIAELQLLHGEVQKADNSDIEALQYRLDGRSFALLTDLDQLIAEVAALPHDSEQRKRAEALLSSDFAGISDTVFKRLEELESLLVSSRSERDSLSGGARISMGLYIYSLESIRFDYYNALIEHFGSRKSLGLSSDQFHKKLETALYLHSEKLAGQVEFTNASRQELQNQLAIDPDNTELDAALTTLSLQHDGYVGRLELATELLDRLGVDSSEYKAVLLKESGEFSVDMLERSVLKGVLGDWLVAVKESAAANAPDFLFNLIVFLAIVLFFRFLSRLTRRVVERSCESSSLDLSELLKDILISGSGGAVMVLGILMALSQVGISLGPMLAGLGVAGFVIGFALQDTLGNFAAGAMILIYRPYDVDDFVEVTGASGLVRKMNLVSTTIVTFDNQTLVVPNSKIWGDVIKNVTAQKIRRVDLEFGIGYGDDIEHAERVLEDIVYSHEMVLKKPEALIKLHTLGDSSVNFIVRPWTKTEDYWDVYWDLMREVKMRFDREGISIPFPQRDVHLYSQPEGE